MIMNETMILISCGIEKSSEIKKYEAKRKIDNLCIEKPTMLEWCFSNIHSVKYLESRNFVLETILQIIKNPNYVTIASHDALIQEFFGDIVNDIGYRNPSLINLIANIQVHIIYLLYPRFWPSAFDFEDPNSIINSPDIIFYKFSQILSRRLEKNEDLKATMLSDESIVQMLQRISKDVQENANDAEEIYSQMFKYLDFHFLIEIPCFPHILNEFQVIPYPKLALNILSQVFMKEFPHDERISLIGSMNLNSIFSQFFTSFHIISQNCILELSNLMYFIFFPIAYDSFSLSFGQIFIEILKNSTCENKRMNILFHYFIINGLMSIQNSLNICISIINFYFEKDLYINEGMVNIFHIIFNQVPKELQFQYFSAFINNFIDVSNPKEYFKEIFGLLNGLFSFTLIKESKNILFCILNYFDFLLFIEVPVTIDTSFINDVQLENNVWLFANSLNFYSKILLKAEKYFTSKIFVDMKFNVPLVFYREIQFALQGCDIFYEDLITISSFKYSSLIFSNVLMDKMKISLDEIVVNLICSLNYQKAKIAINLLKSIPENKATELRKITNQEILKNDPNSMPIEKIRSLFLIFFGYMSPHNTHLYNFLSTFKEKLETFDDIKNYIAMMFGIFGYKPYQFLINILNTFNDNPFLYYKIGTIIIDSLIFKFPHDGITEDVVNIIEYLTSNTFDTFPYLDFVISNLETNLENNMLNNHSNHISNDFSENNIVKVSGYFDKFIKFIVNFLPFAPIEVINQVIEICTKLFSYSLLSNETLSIFFNFIIERKDEPLIGYFYTESVKLFLLYCQDFLDKKPFPVNFKECVLEILDFHHKIYLWNSSFAKNLFCKEHRAINQSPIKYDDYSTLMKAKVETFHTESYKLVDDFFEINC